MKRFVTLACALIASAAFATATPSAQPQPLVLKEISKSSWEYDRAYTASHELTKLVFPKLAQEGSMPISLEKRAEIAQKFRSKVKDTELTRCLLKEGLDTFVVNHTIDTIKSQEIRDKLATLWAKHYPNTLLDKSLNLMKSPTFQKVSDEAQKTRQSAIAVMKTMLEDGRVNESEVNAVMAQISDPEVMTFLREGKAYLGIALEERIKELKDGPNTAIQAFMSQNGAKVIKCSPPAK